MKKHFRDLFLYNSWANLKVLITIENNEVKNTKVLLLFSHLLSAQIIWLNRIKEIPTSPFPLWEEYKLRELRSMTEESSVNWLSFIDSHKYETFEEMIFYKNTSDKKFESTVREIITQVINHSTYHRGQIASLLKAEGVEPPVTDYIAYARAR